MDMKELTKRVATAMGNYFFADDNDNIRCTLEDPQFGFCLYHNIRDKKIYIWPVYPTAKDGATYPYDFERPDVRIGVSEKKTPEQIAKDIARRFMPPYREVFAQGMARREERNAFIDKTNDSLNRIAAIVSGEISGESVDVRMRDAERNGYIHLIRVGGGKVEIVFRSVPVDLAAMILQTWQSYVDDVDSKQVDNAWSVTREDVDNLYARYKLPPNPAAFDSLNGPDIRKITNAVMDVDDLDEQTERAMEVLSMILFKRNLLPSPLKS